MCPEPILMPLRAVYRPGSPHFAQYALLSLAVGVRRVRPDVIHVDLPTWSPVFWQAVLARKLFAPRARIVVSAKKNTYRRHRGLTGYVKDRVAIAGLRQTDLVLAASRKAAELYIREFHLPPERVKVLPQLGVDGTVFRPAADERPSTGVVVGFCGRIEVEKGVLDLVEATELARSTHPMLELHIVGSGTLDGQLQALAGARPWLRLHGALPSAEVPAFLRTLDVFVLPARVLPDHEEHDAQALIEALASGVATIGTRSGVIPDLLDDGSGLLVEAGDTAALADAITFMAENGSARRRLARSGYAKARQHLVCEAVAASCAEVYGELALNASPRTVGSGQ